MTNQTLREYALSWDDIRAITPIWAHEYPIGLPFCIPLDLFSFRPAWDERFGIFTTDADEMPGWDSKAFWKDFRARHAGAIAEGK